MARGHGVSDPLCWCGHNRLEHSGGIKCDEYRPRRYYKDLDAFRTDDGKVMVDEGRANVVEYVRADGKGWGERA